MSASSSLLARESWACPSSSMLPVAGCRKNAVTVLLTILHPPPATRLASPPSPPPSSPCAARPAALLPLARTSASASVAPTPALLEAAAAASAVDAGCSPAPALPSTGRAGPLAGPWVSFRFRFFLPPAASLPCVFWRLAPPVAASTHSPSAGVCLARSAPSPQSPRASAGCPRTMSLGALASRTELHPAAAGRLLLPPAACAAGRAGDARGGGGSGTNGSVAGGARVGGDSGRNRSVASARFPAPGSTAAAAPFAAPDWADARFPRSTSARLLADASAARLLAAGASSLAFPRLRESAPPA